MAAADKVNGREVTIAGIPLQGVAGLVGELILKQAQLDLVIDQIRAEHRPRSATYCSCGVARLSCTTRRIIDAYDRQRKGGS